MTKQKTSFELTTEREHIPGHISAHLHLTSTTDDLTVDSKIIGAVYTQHESTYKPGNDPLKLIYETCFYHVWDDGQISIVTKIEHDTFAEALATLMKAVVRETKVI